MNESILKVEQRLEDIQQGTTKDVMVCWVWKNGRMDAGSLCSACHLLLLLVRYRTGRCRDTFWRSKIFVSSVLRVGVSWSEAPHQRNDGQAAKNISLGQSKTFASCNCNKQREDRAFKRADRKTSFRIQTGVRDCPAATKPGCGLPFSSFSPLRLYY
jgi:hypothetical protein